MFKQCFSWSKTVHLCDDANYDEDDNYHFMQSYAVQNFTCVISLLGQIKIRVIRVT
jgi:hypothetical protein